MIAVQNYVSFSLFMWNWWGITQYMTDVAKTWSILMPVLCEPSNYTWTSSFLFDVLRMWKMHFLIFFSWIFIYTAFIYKTSIVNVANIWVNEFVKSSFVILMFCLIKKKYTRKKGVKKWEVKGHEQHNAEVISFRFTQRFFTTFTILYFVQYNRWVL